MEREIEKQEVKLEALEPQIQEAAADYTRLSELLEQQTEAQANWMRCMPSGSSCHRIWRRNIS